MSAQIHESSLGTKAHQKKTPSSFPADLLIKSDELLKYIEVDLWGRFQARLWKVVAAFLTLVTIAGLLGIPYYIKSEISNRLAAQAKTYSDRLEDIAAFSKLLALLTAEQQAHSFSLKADIELVIAELARDNASAQGTNATGAHSSMNNPTQLLNELISRPDITTAIDARFMTPFNFISPEDLKKKIDLPRMFVVENRGFTGAGAFSEPHPVLDGTLGGFLDDIKYRIVVLSAFNSAIERVNNELLRLGGATDLDKRVANAKVVGLEAQLSTPAFQDGIKQIMGKTFLTDDEKKKFRTVYALYCPKIVMPDKSPELPNPQ
jgi:hypothetical protein